MKIGVFDSGLGGLTILKTFLKKLPQYDYVYYGDNARVPYGNRSPEIIYQFTKEAVDFLFKKKCGLIILACNTSTSVCLKKIQQEYIPKYYPNIKVLGVIRPIIESIEKIKSLQIGVIGTKATINSKAFIREINKVLPKSKVFQKACPLLVPFIENSIKNKKILNLLLKEYLNPLIKKNIDLLILGCTHYEIIKKEISKVLGKKIKILSEGIIVAQKLKDYLFRHPEIESKLDKNSKVEYNFSDKNYENKKLIDLFLYDKKIFYQK